MNSESEVPRSIPPDSTSKSLQLVHASHNSTPNPSSSSSPASIQGYQPLSPVSPDYFCILVESQASSTLEKSQANEGDLDQFIPPVDHSNSQELDNFFDDIGEVKVISPARRQDRIVDEGDGSSSSPTALTPTGTTKSLVRIKKKKFDP